MTHGRSWRRRQRKRVITRKERILLSLGGKENLDGWTRGKRGRLAKGKIHCSCWMCRSKSYDVLSHRDAKRLDDVAEQFKGEV